MNEAIRQLYGKLLTLKLRRFIHYLQNRGYWVYLHDLGREPVKMDHYEIMEIVDTFVQSEGAPPERRSINVRS